MDFSDVKKIAVIGSGDMGHGIVQVAAMAGYNVAMKDVKQEFLDRGVARIVESLDILVGKEKISAQDKKDIMGRISATTDTAEAVQDAQIVIEAVPEIMDLKKSVFSEVSASAPDDAILATNTSTMSISEISKAVNNPARFAGLHFFNPVNRMKLVEIIKGAETSGATADILVKFTEAIKKIPVVVLKDSPGFIVNRINAPNQAMLSAILDEGKIKPDELDTAMKMVGMPQGPYELADFVGLDVFVHTLKYYAETLSPEFRPGKYLTAKVEAGDLGKKTGQGIYDWSSGKPLIDGTTMCQDITPMEMLAIQINEAVRVHKEGIAASVADIDLAVVHGMKAMAGPFAMCAGMQPEQLVTSLDKLHQRFGLAIFKPEPEVADGSFKEMK
ncbi:3-hydroxyacyl-CoA dehydrogenase [Desulfatibacillum alkenivorans DSM 16219]|jgi:enoyl-CoA hydratase/3-hydroxyacyl-CoA dehydrogenase|uniref:3-hydroxyacyl-CoA dehydrogenase n=1 Tax=Desulfatibacillum alkenivorans DSM 16219 TaxID=1121393 RepID=A0A1M6JZD9_9BACT|nr:3-hydroxyacyl-CoA dehydrogenase family protein [Desulfatibacillum alkenivorans]SHJ52079.1 3-hydroxyacyl-CoA dehydrogenase [Desulfatibacillum alkenivorans DSM 16219]